MEADPYYRKAHDACSWISFVGRTVRRRRTRTLAARQIGASYLRQSADRLHVGRYDRINSGFFTAETPILALTPNEETARALSLCWGVYARLLAPQTFDENQIFADVLGAAVDVAADYRVARESDAWRW